MSENIKVTYQDIEIEYLEGTDQWRFELRGRERNAESLKQAKEWIDKPEPAKKGDKKKFERFQATLVRHGYMSSASKASREIVTITSIAEGNFASRQEVWVVKSDGSRSKERADSLYAITPENTEKWNRYDATNETKDRLDAQMRGILKSISTIDLKQYGDA